MAGRAAKKGTQSSFRFSTRMHTYIPPFPFLHFSPKNEFCDFLFSACFRRLVGWLPRKGKERERPQGEVAEIACVQEKERDKGMQDGEKGKEKKRGERKGKIRRKIFYSEEIVRNEIR